MIKKIGIASEGKDVNAQVCAFAGRAPYYLIIEDGELVKVIKNPFLLGGGGAGLGVAQMLFNENVNLVISGKFGEKMIDMLEEKKIEYKVVENKKVSEVLE